MRLSQIIEELHNCFAKDGKFKTNSSDIITNLIADIRNSELSLDEKTAISRILNDLKSGQWQATDPEYGQMADLAQEYKQQIKPDVYKSILISTKIAHVLENQNGMAQDHALKLAILFDDFSKAIQYLKNQASRTVALKEAGLTVQKRADQTNEHIVHNACLFTLPHPEANWSAWRRLVTPDMMVQEKVKDLLGFSNQLEQMVKDETSSDGQEKAIGTAGNTLKKAEKELKVSEYKARKSLKDEEYTRYVGILKKELKNIEKEFLKLDKRHGDLDNTEKEKYKALILAKTHFKIAISKALSGKNFSELKLDDLLCHYTRYQDKTSGALKYFAKNKIDEKKYVQFKKLNRTKAGENIPDVAIDGAEIGYPGCYMRKLDVKNSDIDAAIAACLGKLTNCCQSISGEVGEPCAINGLTSPNGGFYVIFRKKELNPDDKFDHDSVIAQSWVWRGRNNELVFDSVEGFHVHGSDQQKPLSAFYNHASKKAVCEENSKYNITDVLVGTGGKTPEGIGIATNLNAKPQDDLQYRDSKQQRLLASKYMPYLNLGNSSIEETKQAATKILVDQLSKEKSFDNNIFFDRMAFNLCKSLETIIKSTSNIDKLIENFIKSHFKIEELTVDNTYKLSSYLSTNIIYLKEISSDQPDINKIIDLIKTRAVIKLQNHKKLNVLDTVTGNINDFKEIIELYSDKTMLYDALRQSDATGNNYLQRIACASTKNVFCNIIEALEEAGITKTQILTLFKNRNIADQNIFTQDIKNHELWEYLFDSIPDDEFAGFFETSDDFSDCMHYSDPVRKEKMFADLKQKLPGFIAKPYDFVNVFKALNIEQCKQVCEMLTVEDFKNKSQIDKNLYDIFTGLNHDNCQCVCQYLKTINYQFDMNIDDLISVFRRLSGYPDQLKILYELFKNKLVDYIKNGRDFNYVLVCFHQENIRSEVFELLKNNFTEIINKVDDITYIICNFTKQQTREFYDLSKTKINQVLSDAEPSELDGVLAKLKNLSDVQKDELEQLVAKRKSTLKV